MITVHHAWAEPLALDCEAALSHITISSMSLHAPRGATRTAYARLWRAWCNAAARGVRVAIYLPQQTATHPATLQNNSSATAAHANGIAVHFVPAPRLLHAKSVLIDQSICWIGSGNMTMAAAQANHEIYVRFHSRDIAADIAHRWHQIATT
jgi:phosphatidylserine/phosphatidylglycerophosphate/cardiolipin synthase-like enzyme